MNKILHGILIMGLVAACSVGSPQPCSAEPLVILRTDAHVRGATVKLSDIFDGVPADIDREIAQAPAPGKQVIYDVSVLRRVADKYRLDWEPQSAADHTTVTTDSTRITADAIREAVIKKVKDTTPLPRNGSVDVSFDTHNLQIDLPADRGSDFTLNNFEFDPTSKRFHADLVAEGAGGPFAAPLLGRINFKRSVPVLVRRLEGGTTVSAGDVDYAIVPEDRVTLSVMTDASQLIGRELRRDTDEGEIIHIHDVIPPRLVTRGAIVTMKIETPVMLVTAQGKAMQDGAQGEVIRVLNTQSNRLLEGTVSSPGTVTISTASQKIAAAQ